MNRPRAGHIIAAMLLGQRAPRPMDALELEALHERCRTAELLELGQILHETTDALGQQIVADEINHRLGER